MQIATNEACEALTTLAPDDIARLEFVFSKWTDAHRVAWDHLLSLGAILASVRGPPYPPNAWHQAHVRVWVPWEHVNEACEATGSLRWAIGESTECCLRFSWYWPI